MKKPTYEELEKENKRLSEFWIYLGFVALIYVLVWSYQYNKFEEENAQLKEQISQLSTAEVINGNLYVGYEDGVRIGFHQDYNGTWYERVCKKCGRQWGSLHCQHDGVQGTCPNCKTRAETNLSGECNCEFTVKVEELKKRLGIK